jgi:integrase/recombinase XerD
MNTGKYINKLSEYMIYKKYSECSLKTYISNITLFLESFQGIATKPTEISRKDIIEFLSEIQSPNTHKSYLSAIKLFYKKIINQPEKLKRIEQPIINRKLPIVFTHGEVQKMFNVCDNLKHKIILSLLYGCGLRRTELLNLKWEHINRNAMILNVVSGKGKKDRQVDLPENIIPLLEKYYMKYNGIDIGYIQNSAGHKHTDTSRLYIQLSHNVVKNAVSPLNNIKL